MWIERRTIFVRSHRRVRQVIHILLSSFRRPPTLNNLTSMWLLEYILAHEHTEMLIFDGQGFLMEEFNRLRSFSSTEGSRGIRTIELVIDLANRVGA